MDDSQAEKCIHDFAEVISQRNPGAVDVFFRLLSHLGEGAAADFTRLIQMNVLGLDLYQLFAYCCDRDIAKMHEVIANGTAIEQLRGIRGSSFYPVQAQESER